MNESNWTWTKGIVDTAGEHFKIFYSDEFADNTELIPVAVMSRCGENNATIEFLMPSSTEANLRMKIIEDVENEIEFYLCLKKEPDPWRYLIYHCGTASNLYSKVHWSYYSAKGM